MKMGDEAEINQRRRLPLENFLTLEECRELEFIHKSCCTVGYRPYVFSTTLLHLVVSNSAHLIMPFVSIRERLKEKAEEFFGCEYELFVEFTGLISWTRGARIGWHSDDNRPYLKQREFTAVCYLNSYGVDFEGGLFHFQDGEPKTISPLCGDCVMYTADSLNVHSVDEVTSGERLTLTLWFTRDSSHDEDAKLVSLLSQSHLHDRLPDSCLPQPPSCNMYWFSPKDDPNFKFGFDICWARLHALGYGIYFPQDHSLSEYPDLFSQDVQLVRGNKIFSQKFDSILHALQVVQFLYWKGKELDSTNSKEDSSYAEGLSPKRNVGVDYFKSEFSKDDALAESVFLYASSDVKEKQHRLGWAKLAAVAAAWEDYASNLRRELLRSFAHWRTSQSIYSVPYGS
ncbi:prolyl 3-hydroxylase 1 isoform X1 [Cucurbita moschata]|uniref:procollagen-proline 3-dioxygenase n=1 Tax=Cucurbita moschata TaxID=3662 RepID=A0A6J1FRP8_CUCMO|nr:prolyl 3-hydroxylase 1 isoform X1 [Cucurbita moschata]